MDMSLFMLDDPTEVKPPTSTDDIIIFPWDKSSKTFKRKDYSPSLTNKRASLEQVEDFLKVMETIVQQKMSSSTFDASINMLKYGVPFGVIMYGLQQSFSFPLHIWTLLVIVWIAGMYLARFAEKQRRRSTSENIKQNLKKALEKESLEKRFLSFHEKGLRWKIPVCFPQWIELHNDYKSKGTDKEKDLNKKDELNKKNE